MNSSDYRTDVLNQDFGRHKLTVGSMDTIWETHPHRLNEAGLVRHSDTSILTEDTDSFIIGDKVWVGGCKPGQIAYIGETQFAPGEWAGIVLDQPIGKNDGSVSGTRYFQCEPKRGVFSRLTRLTRVPLPDAEDYARSVTPVNNGQRHRGGSPLSPTGSTKSLRKSPSLSTSNTSLVSATNPIDFKIGDRVIIKSTQGSKVGTLRFMGPTYFAPGEWCGIELDEPRGKNDGSVEGVRYFECQPQYGLFSLVAKVSKSPLKYKPGNCVVHSGAHLPPSGVKRAGSKESILSMTSSIASTNASNARRVVTSKTGVSNFPSRSALQDVLREKQQHIEQLLKERDLENAEFTRAAHHAEKVQQQLANVQAEYEHYRLECERKVHEFTDALAQLNIDKKSVLSQLDDERRRNEDLQFRFEEAAISKGDIEVANRGNAQKITDLERQLRAERLRSDQLEAESSRLFEAEEALVKSRDEIEILKSDLEKVVQKRDVLQVEHTSSTDTAASLKHELDTTKAAYDMLQRESSKQIDELKLNIANSRTDNVEIENELSGYKNKLKDRSSDCEQYEQEVGVLKEELSQSKSKITDSQSEVERLKAQLLEKDQLLVAKTDEIRSLKALLETTNIDLNARAVDVERYQRSKDDAEIVFKKEIEYLKQTLMEKINERENIEKTAQIDLAQKGAEIAEATNTIRSQVTEINRLQKDLSEAKLNIERNSIDVHERHTRQIAIQEAEMMSITVELQSAKEELTKSSIVIDKLQEDICTKNSIIEKLNLEFDSFKKQCTIDQVSAAESMTKITELQLVIGDLQRKLSGTEVVINDLNEQKLRLEQELRTVIESTGDYSSQLRELNTAVLEKEQLIATVREEYAQKLQLSQGIEQQLQLQLTQMTEESQRTIGILEEKLRLVQQTEQMLRDQCAASASEAVTIREQLMLQVSQLQSVIEEKELALKVAIGENAETKRFLTEQLDRIKIELQGTVESCRLKVDEITAENINIRNTLTLKSQELIEAEANCKILSSQLQMNNEDMRRTHDELIKQMQFDLTQKTALVNQYLTELELLKRDCQNRDINVVEKDRMISELTVKLNENLLLIAQLQRDKDALQLSQVEAQKEWAIQNQQCTNLVNQVAILTEKVGLGESLALELQAQKNIHEKLLEQLTITEQQKHDLITRLELEVNNNGDTERCSYLLDLAKSIQASTGAGTTHKINELQSLLETTRLSLSNCQVQVNAQREEILRLQNEVLMLDTAATGELIGDSQTGGQISFLNSIIVDMRKKNEEQRERIELLESGFSPGAVNDLHLLERPTRAKAPRVYCDICETFDGHETEDCPLQATDPDLLPPPSRGKKAAPASRPYCEICEIFGHCTEDCTEQDQTF